ncbi:MAG: CoA-binding protein [Bacteroidota bacterium]
MPLAALPTLVLGASTNPDRYSYLAMQMLAEAGIEVWALGSRPGMIDGIQIHTTWDELPAGDLDTITLYIGPERQPAYYEQILSVKPRRIIFNPGTENPVLEQLANSQGIQTLQACTLVMLRTNLY